ncbi:fas apoptotic inhibitory molecule 3 [Hippopotamus amphibius kiboko]|uniref:fas apoptotic inhibitory molecule 3 n=1 Tax=Hippopotamus amphibius kiboko TaxID=575201 RepID=UPI0025915396|nr:fas apoptotic inhibitory molecule 3 [Hippopotamus amphibius kiboko]
MDLWLWSLYFLPVAGALKALPEVKVEGMLGGSVVIQCPLPEVQVRIYLCRTVVGSGVCTTVVSNRNFIKKEFKRRVTLELCPDRNLFLVEITNLIESDSGVYACGVGTDTDRGKTQQVTLTVHSDYEPFWEEETMPKPPAWLNRFLQIHMPPWFQMPAHASSFELISKVTTPAQRTEAPPAHHASPTTSITHHPRVYRVSPLAIAEPTTLLPSTTASKTSAREEPLRLQTDSYNHQTRLHRQRAFNHGPGPVPGREDQGFHILIPTTLGLLLLALLGLVAKRVIQRRKAFSRRVRRLAGRMRALEASQRPRVSQRPRTQNNIYSACPRRPRGVDAAGVGAAPLPGSRATASPALAQVAETPWLHAPSLKISCEYVSFCHQPVAKMEDTDSNDYVNIPCLTQLSSCPPGPRAWCQ